MRFQSFIRQCKAGRDCMQGGSTLYTFHVTEQGVMIGVLDSRDGMSESQAFWCPELSDAQGLALTRRLYEESVSLEQVPYVLSDMQVLFRMSPGSMAASGFAS